MINGKKIGLVLSGGGAKGFAHIGVLKVLEENGIKPDIVVGTSMGSTVGGLYASGMTIAELEKEARKFKATNIIDVNLFNMFSKGLNSGSKFEAYLEKLAKTKNIEDFPIKYACIGCDLKTGKQYVFDSGKFSVASRTSSTIPGLYAPLEKDDMMLVDGGLVNNIPTDVAYQLGADYVISVDCIGKAYLLKDMKNIVDILMSSFSLTQYLYNKKLKIKADAKLVISNYNHSYFDHTKEEIIDIIHSGEIVALKKIQRIKNDLFKI